MNGVDSSVLVYALDPETKEHGTAKDAVLSLQALALNPTVVHEVYHTLVFKRGIAPRDAKSKVKAVVRDRRTHFFNLTRSISLYSLDMASEFNMGGRDALIVGCYAANGVDTLLTHDAGLLALRKITFKGRELSFRDPLA